MGAGELFIVDNSDQHWKALDYLREWCDLSSSIDIATGYLEIGALLALDGAWQKVDKIRILIGAETSRQTVQALAEARHRLEASIEDERATDPFLAGVEAVIEGIVSGKVEIRVFRKKKFHAKAYITHGRVEVVGSAALVGSSNFTRPGLTQNVELNVRFSSVEVRELQLWFETYWAEAEDATADLLEVLERQSRPVTPFEIYAKALQTLTANADPSTLEWEQHESRLYRHLSPYQREGYHDLKQKAALRGGAFLTDGVGLGKTYVGMMLAEYYAVQEGKNVLILATKTGKEAVWAPALERYMPDLIGDFTRIRVMAHTDLSSASAVDEVRKLRERVDVIIVDEAHNFRNRGKLGDDPARPRSRWRRLQMLAEGKLVFLLTATPINNTLFDLVHELELWTGLTGQGEPADRHFETLGIASISSYISRLERTFLRAVGKEQNERAGDSVTMADFEEMLKDDRLRANLIVQHSRQYAVDSARLADGGTPVRFPEPAMPRVVPYSYNLPFSRLLDELERACAKVNPLFTLPMYYPLYFSTRSDINTQDENRERQVVALIRTVFLKRFESSIAAFTGSCLDLIEKIVSWIDLNAVGHPFYESWAQEWRATHDDLLAAAAGAFRPDVLPGSAAEEETEDDDNDSSLLAERSDVLNPAEYRLDEMFEAAVEDLHQLIGFVERAVAVGLEDDEKFKRLLELLKGRPTGKSEAASRLIYDPAFTKHKVLVFTEFADTAKYLERRLTQAGLADVDRLDGSRKSDRLAMIRRFSPFYNGVQEADRRNLEPLRVLVSTDVLAEGVNLQDASLVVNYDIHWNPVRLMQRIGRIDRRMDEEVERALLHEHPELAASRGTVEIRNFLPPEELERLLNLHGRVTNRATLISKTLGIPGGRFLTEEDLHDDAKVFTTFKKDYYGELSVLERLRLDYLEMLRQDPGLGARVDALPRGVHACKESADVTGTFVCSIEPVPVIGPEGSVVHWTLDEGVPRWALLLSDGTFSSDPGEIAKAIRCPPDAPRAALADRDGAQRRLSAIRGTRLGILRKEIQLPLDAPEPSTVCWMELR